MLDQLALDEVIRRRIDPGTSETSWLLDHDYLARAVREADRRANRWQRALADGAKTLAGAGDSWPRSWRALLPPTTQLRFLWDRLRGRFRYGEHRRYAAKSLQRFAPIMVILLSVAAAGWEWGRVRAEERLARSAEDILNGLEFEQGKVAESDAKALLRLASAANEVRQHALMLVLTNQDRARVFVREPEMVVRAIAGVSPQFRDWAKLCLGSVAGLSASRPETTVAASKAALLLGRPEALTLHWYLATIESTKDPEALRTVAEALKVFAATLDDGRAKDAAGPFLAAIKSTRDPNALEALAEGLGALPVKLSDRQAKEAIEPFLDALKETGIKPPAFKALAEGLKALPVKPDDSQTRELVKQFLAITKGGASGSDLKALGAGLKAFTTTLSESQASDAVAPLLTAMQSTENPSELQVLAEGLGALPAKLTDSQAQEAVEPFLAAIKGSTNPYTLQTLAEGLSALPVKLSDTQAKEFAEPFVVALSSNTGSLLTRDLGAAVEALPARIEVIKPLLAAMNSNTDPFSQYALGSGMRGIAKLGEDQAMELVEPFLTAIEASINKGIANHIALEGLVAAFGALPARLDDRQAQETIRLFVRESQQASHPSTLPVELKVMPAKLDANQARAAVAPLLSAIRDATDPSTLWALAAGIGALPTALSDSEVTKAVEPLLATIRDATDPSTLWALGAGLGALPGKLSDGQARVAVEPFLAAFERTSEASVLFALGAGLDAFAVKLDRRSAAAAKIAVNQAFKSTLDQQTFALYARLSVKLAKGEPADQQAGSIFHLLRHPLSAGDPAPNLFVPLEQVPGVQTKFGGDLWKAVEWAEAEQKAGRLKNLELDTPLQIN